MAVTVAPVVADSPVDGLQVYVLAPLAVSVVGAPEQTETGFTVITGKVFTVTVTVTFCVCEQPLLSDTPVRLYV